MTEVLSYPMNTIQMPISYYTEKDARYFDSLGRELFVDTMYVLRLDMGLPFISVFDETLDRRVCFELPDFCDYAPELGSNNRRRWLKMYKFRRIFPESVLKQYFAAEKLGVFGATNLKMIESGAVVRELMRKLTMYDIVCE